MEGGGITAEQRLLSIHNCHKGERRCEREFHHLDILLSSEHHPVCRCCRRRQSESYSCVPLDRRMLLSSHLLLILLRLLFRVASSMEQSVYYSFMLDMIGI